MSVVRCVRFRVVVLVRARDLEAFYVFRGDVNIESRGGGGGSGCLRLPSWGGERWRWVRLERRCGIGGEVFRWMR